MGSPGIAVEAQDVEYSYEPWNWWLVCAVVGSAWSDNSSLDDAGHVVAKPRAVGQQIGSDHLPAHNRTVELSDETVKFYRKQKLPKMTLFQAWPHGEPPASDGVFCKAKGNEMYMSLGLPWVAVGHTATVIICLLRVYTELVRLGFVEQQQFPHALWGDCYCYVNSLIARHGYRLELESELNSAAVEAWKEAKCRGSASAAARDDGMVLDETFLMPYEIADTPLTARLKALKTVPLQVGLRRLNSRTSMQLMNGGSLVASTNRASAAGGPVWGPMKGHTFGDHRMEWMWIWQPGTTFRLGGSEAPQSLARCVRSRAHEQGGAKAAERHGRGGPGGPPRGHEGRYGTRGWLMLVGLGWVGELTLVSWCWPVVVDVDELVVMDVDVG
eukprot:Skav225889  [mRNA]  locus=scaffold1460:95686:107170:- [translate_table: standard]